MITKEEKREVTTNVEGQEFTVASTAYTFKTLSDKLYSNKIRAIIRELSTNAYDSHVEAGKKNVPFIVHLPNILEPTFYVEDFGTGMSEEKVMELYSSYFASDKRETNKAIGTFGLGSKSPFAYKSTFTVVSRYEGEETIYSCYLNEHEIPCIAKVISQETTQGNGVKVEIPVDENKFREFEFEAREVLRPFDVPVTVRGVREFKIKEYPETIIDGKNYKVFNKQDEYGRANIQIAVQGNIEYIVDLYQLFESDEWKNFQTQYQIKNAYTLERFFKRNNFLIEIPMGGVTFPPSREHLEYTPYTKNNLIRIFYRMFQDILGKIEKEIEENIDSKLNLVTAINNFRKLTEINFLDMDRIVNGKTLTEHLKTQGYEEKVDFECFNAQNLDWHADNNYKAVKHRVYQNEVFRFFLYTENQKMKIVYHDEQDNDSTIRSGLYRLKQHIRKEGFRALVVYNKNFLRDFGIEDYQNISSFDYLKKPGRKSSNSNKTDDTLILKEECLYSSSKSRKVYSERHKVTIEDALNDTDTKVFVHPYYSKYQTPAFLGSELREIEGFEIKKEISNLAISRYGNGELNDDDHIVTIYYISKADMQKKDMRDHNWISLDTYLYNEWKRLDADVNFQDVYAQSLIRKQKSYTYIQRDQRNARKIFEETILKNDSRVSILLNNLENFENNTAPDGIDLDFSNINETLRNYGLEKLIEINSKNTIENVYNELKNLYTVICAEYPMLRLMEWEDKWNLDDKKQDDWNEINYYIEMVDKQ